MNLKGFKKVHEDDNKAVLKNQHGHSITIAKDKLSKPHLSDLASLPLHAEDGAIVPASDDKQDKPKSFASNFLGDSSNQLGSHPSMMPNNISQAPVMDSNLATPMNLPPDTEDDRAPLSTPVNQQPAQNNEEEDDSENADESQPGAGQPPAPPKEPEQPPIQTPEDVYKETKNQLAAESANVNHDLISGAVQPKTMHELFAEKSTLGKIGTIFGMMLSGIGSGMTHQPNVLLEMMGKEIDRDLESQKASGINAQNLYSLNLRKNLQKYEIPKLISEKGLNDAETQYNIAKATNETAAGARITANWTAFHKLTQIAESYPQGTPERQRADQILGALYPVIQNENVGVADKAAAAAATLQGFNPSQGSANSANLSPINYDRWNQLQRGAQAKMPGFPSEQDLGNMTTEAKGLEEATALKKDFDSTFNELDKKFLAGSLTPNDRASAVNSLKGKLAKIAEGRYSGMSGDLINAMLPQGGDWGKTRLNKKERDARFFDILKSGTPTLNRWQVLNNSSSRSQGQQQSGNQQYSEGQILKLRDGSTAKVIGGKVYRQ